MLTATTLAIPKKLAGFRGPLLLATVLVVICVFFAWAVFGSVEHSLQYCLGQRLILCKPTITKASAKSGEECHVKVGLENIGFREAKIVGAQTSCKCSRVSGLPVILLPGKHLNLLFDVTPPRSAVGKPFSTSVIFYVNEWHPPIVAKIVVDRVL